VSRRSLLARGMSVLEGTAAVLLFVLMVIVLVDVTLRNTVNRPLPWGTEVLEVVLGAMIFLLYPVLALGSGHITVDLIATRPAVQRVQRVLAGVVGATLFGLIGWCLGRQSLRAAEYGDGTPLLGIRYSWVLGGMAALAVVAAACFVVAIVRGLRQRPGAA
jgi:TRAP-type C4-dicarboxylate transport system permease small subunit